MRLKERSVEQVWLGERQDGAAGSKGVSWPDSSPQERFTSFNTLLFKSGICLHKTAQRLTPRPRRQTDGASALVPRIT